MSGREHPSRRWLSLSALTISVAVCAGFALSMHALAEKEGAGSNPRENAPQSPADSPQKSERPSASTSAQGKKNDVEYDILPESKYLPTKRRGREIQSWDEFGELIQEDIQRTARRLELQQGRRSQAASGAPPAPQGIKVAIAKTKPPLGFGHLRLRMPQAELGPLLRTWQGISNEEAPDSPYRGVERLEVLLSDGELIRLQPGSKPRPTAGERTARVCRVVVQYRWMPLHGGPDGMNKKAVTDFLIPLWDRYGNPGARDSGATGVMGVPNTRSYTQDRELIRGFSVEDALILGDIFHWVYQFRWAWPSDDTDLTCTTSVYPASDVFVVWLELDWGIRERARQARATEEAKRQAEEKERTRRAKALERGLSPDE